MIRMNPFGRMNKMIRMIPAGLDGRQKAESVIRNEEFGNGRMEIGIRKEETAKWKQDSQSRKEERGIRNLELGNREKTMNEKLGLWFWIYVGYY